MSANEPDQYSGVCGPLKTSIKTIFQSPTRLEHPNYVFLRNVFMHYGNQISLWRCEFLAAAIFNLNSIF